MPPSVPPSSSASSPAPGRPPLPPAIQAAYAQFQAGGALVHLDAVVLAILSDFIPRESARPLVEMPGTTTLIEELGFDSLAITEVVFFAEDLFGISITNEEIMQVSTLDDLRGFIRRKVAGRTAH